MSFPNFIGTLASVGQTLSPLWSSGQPARRDVNGFAARAVGEWMPTMDSALPSTTEKPEPYNPYGDIDTILSRVKDLPEAAQGPFITSAIMTPMAAKYGREAADYNFKNQERLAMLNFDLQTRGADRMLPFQLQSKFLDAGPKWIEAFNNSGQSKLDQQLTPYEVVAQRYPFSAQG